jgi:transposase
MRAASLGRLVNLVILAIVWPVIRQRKRRCPVCGEDVNPGITVCPSCGHDFAAASPTKRSASARG